MKSVFLCVKDIVKSMGLVFGDIGTSPIYTLSMVFFFLTPTVENVVGVISLILWTLMLLVTVKYSWLVMSLSRRAEGGTIVLKEILTPLFRTKGRIALITILTFIAISLLIGDGVITPAVTILSAVEGLLLIPGFETLSSGVLVFIAAVIVIGLFLFQKKGADRVAIAFGPIMLIWFLCLGFFGFIYILKYPAILKAFNPYYGIKFILDYKFLGFCMLSYVILCATGVEALYADMGHLGRKPIIRAWHLVFISLALNYLGQGVFLIQNLNIKNSFFGMVLNSVPFFYIPFLILSCLASIIASQAMISGVFSIVYQGIATRIMPIFKIDYTSTRLRSQIYIGFINWFLMFFVLVMIFTFKKSEYLMEAYGLAVTGTMTITGILATTVFYFRRDYIKALISGSLIFVDVIFLLSVLTKIPQGAYWSIIIALFPFLLILVYTTGHRRMRRSFQPMTLDVFIDSYEEVYEKVQKIKGTALFFTKELNRVPPYIIKTMLMDHIIYEENILVSILILDVPFGFVGSFEKNISDGLKSFRIKAGYMEVLRVEEILKKSGINERVIFYGIEDIVTSNPIWGVFSFIKKVTPSYVQLYKLPVEKLHGVVTRVEM